MRVQITSHVHAHDNLFVGEGKENDKHKDIQSDFNVQIWFGRSEDWFYFIFIFCLKKKKPFLLSEIAIFRSKQVKLNKSKTYGILNGFFK